MSPLLSLFHPLPVVVVLRAESAEDVLWIAESLIVAGFRCLELTTTIPDWETCLSALHKPSQASAVSLGMGTVTTKAQAEKALQLGARFIASPGWVEAVGAVMQSAVCPYWPGVMTPTEILSVQAKGFSTVKLFPAKPLGKASYVRCLRNPFPNLQCIPFGGLTIEDVAPMLEAGAVAVGLGSSLMPTDEELSTHDSETYQHRLHSLYEELTGSLA